MTSIGNSKVDFLGRELKVGQYVICAHGFDKTNQEDVKWCGVLDARYPSADLRLVRVIGFSEHLVYIGDKVHRRRPQNVCIVDQALAAQYDVFWTMQDA